MIGCSNQDFSHVDIVIVALHLASAVCTLQSLLSHAILIFFDSIQLSRESLAVLVDDCLDGWFYLRERMLVDAILVQGMLSMRTLVSYRFPFLHD